MNRLSVKAKTIALNRSKNLNELAKHRRACRNDAFSMGRNLGAADTEDIIEEEEIQVNDKMERAQIADSRRCQLEKWKEEKKIIKKKLTQVSHKPVFKTGIVHHTVGSPNLYKTSNPPQAPKSVASKHTVSHHNAKSPLKVFVAPRRGAQTRNMTKQTAVKDPSSSNSSNAMMGVPMNTKFKPPKGLSAFAGLTVPHTPKAMSRVKQISRRVAAIVSPSKKVTTTRPAVAFPQQKVAMACVAATYSRTKIATPSVVATTSPRKTVATAIVVATSPRKKVATATPSVVATSLRKKVATATATVATTASPRKKVAAATPTVAATSPRKRVATATATVATASPRKRVVTATVVASSPRKRVAAATPTVAATSPRKKVATATVVATSLRKKVATPTPNVVSTSPRKRVATATATVATASPRKRVAVATPTVAATSPRKKVATATVVASSPRKKVNAASIVVAAPLELVAATTGIASGASTESPSTAGAIRGPSKATRSTLSAQKKGAVTTPGAHAQQVEVSTQLLTDGDETTGVEKQRGPIYFRNLLDSEVSRLNSLCDTWSSTKTSLPENASEDITSRFDVAIGQTQLLIRSKLNQFRGLTHDCERGDCNPPILTDDLQGFWEMVNIQIQGMDKLFAELAQLQASDWQEKKPCPVAAKKAKAPAAAKPAAKPVAARAGNNIRAMIAAARKKQLAEQNKMEEKLTEKASALQLLDPRMEEIKATPVDSSKRRSLLKQVLSDRAAKRVVANSPIIMKVTRQAKLNGSFVEEGAHASTSTTDMETDSQGVTSVVWMQPAPVAPQTSILSSSSCVRTGRTLRQSVMDRLNEGRNRSRRSMATTVGESIAVHGKENAAATLNSSFAKTPTQAIVEKLAALHVTNDAYVPSLKTLSASKSRTPIKRLRQSKVGTPARAPTPAKVPKGLDRVSLLPCQSEVSPVCLASSMDDLISFDTPVRRSTRIAHL